MKVMKILLVINLNGTNNHRDKILDWNRVGGNVVTDDLVFMLEAMGLSTGVNLDRLLQTRAYMESCLKDEVTRGAIATAGVPKGF